MGVFTRTAGPATVVLGISGAIAVLGLPATAASGPSYAIGNRVWHDTNRDGRQSPGEPGVNGVTVALSHADGSPVLDGDGRPVRTVTATGPAGRRGYYVFDGLPAGDYRIAFSDFPGGDVLTAEHTGSDGSADSDPDPATGRTALVTVGPGTGVVAPAKDGRLLASAINRTVDAGLTAGMPVTTARPGHTRDLGLTGPCYALGDQVWRDLDRNGVQGPGEKGVDGVTVTLLDAAGTPVIRTDGTAVTTTTADGHYVFDCLPPGSYRVRFGGLPAGMSLTKVNAGMNDSTDSDAIVSTATTAAVTLGPGLPPVSPSLDGALTAATIDRTVHAGLVGPVYALGSYVWLDADADGVQDPAEPGVNGVAARLLDANGDPVTDAAGKEIQTITATGPDGAMGFYLFDDLAPGTYAVEFGALPTQYTATVPDLGGDDEGDSDVDTGTLRSSPITIGAGEAGMDAPDPDVDGDIDADEVNRTLALGLVGPCLAIGNYVWVDTDGNGRQGDAESGMNGVDVTLWDFDGNEVLDADGDQYSTTTGNGPNGDPGFYQFPCLPAGGYVVVVDVPSGMTLTRADVPGTAEGDDSDFEDSGDSFGDSGPIVLDAGEQSVTAVDSLIDGPIPAAFVERGVDAGLVVLDAAGPPDSGPAPADPGSPSNAGHADNGPAAVPPTMEMAATGPSLASVLRDGLLFLVAGTGLVGISLAVFGATQLRRRRR